MSNASTAPIMMITTIIAAMPNSKVCAVARSEGCEVFDVGAGDDCITLKLVPADDGQ